MLVSIANNKKTRQAVSTDSNTQAQLKILMSQVKDIRNQWLQTPQTDIPQLDLTLSTYVFQFKKDAKKAFALPCIALFNSKLCAYEFEFKLVEKFSQFISFFNQLKKNFSTITINYKVFFYRRISLSDNTLVIEIVNSRAYDILQLFDSTITNKDSFDENSIRRFFVFNKPILLYANQTYSEIKQYYSDFLKIEKQHKKPLSNSNALTQLIRSFNGFHSLTKKQKTSRMFRTLYANETFDRFVTQNLNNQQQISVTRNAHIFKVLGHKILDESEFYLNLRLHKSEIFAKTFLYKNNISVKQNNTLHVENTISPLQTNYYQLLNKYLFNLEKSMHSAYFSLMQEFLDFLTNNFEKTPTHIQSLLFLPNSKIIHTENYEIFFAHVLITFFTQYTNLHSRSIGKKTFIKICKEFLNKNLKISDSMFKSICKRVVQTLKTQVFPPHIVAYNIQQFSSISTGFTTWCKFQESIMNELR